MRYDVIIIGAGISGLTCASLLSKRGLRVIVIDKSYNPGGSCGIFKRNDIIFDQGAAMLYGFGEKGFNPHRFVFNCLEEPINVIRHDLLYCVNYMGKRIKFWPDIDKFSEELGNAFPSEKANIEKFYNDLYRMYQHVMLDYPMATPDENDGKSSMKSVLKHPLSFVRFMSFMNKNTKSLLVKYFKDPEIFKFFNKLTSTYCYTTVEETPAILAAIMFVENHVGGSYYPAGSTVFLPGKLEKVIEENNGVMLYEKDVVKILFENGRPCGVELNDNEKIFAGNIVYSGTVWNLYSKLIAPEYLNEARKNWAKDIIPTYPSVVLYAYVDRKVIPEGTLPIEMMIGNPDRLDESEVTAYIMSIDDHTLCEADGHVITAIGPSFEHWNRDDYAEYTRTKEKERLRLLEVLEKRFPGFKNALRFSEVATPMTIERYTNKNGGAVAGPKQMIGQHMFHRMHIKSEWETLYCCGESTVMGTGTPAVTVSGISAANALLMKLGLEKYISKDNMKNYVNILNKPFERDNQYAEYPEEQRGVMNKAAGCQYCEKPACMKNSGLDIRGIMRRVTVGNFVGAKRLVDSYSPDKKEMQNELTECEMNCNQNVKLQKPVEIKSVISYLL